MIGRNTSFENVAAKKDLTIETTVIGPFTLRFATRELESRWQRRHLNRQRGISQRFLLMCAIFQLLFYFSEHYDEQIESNNSDLIRSACGLLVLGACALISTSTVQPSQWFLFVVVFAYGMMTVFVFLIHRSHPCQWDSLFLVYGLVFVMLPKISPLDFVFGLTLALIYTVVFLTISAGRLSLGEWALSSSYLLVVLMLFGYLAYTSERSSRERWLLRQRLQREHITLQLLPTSLSQDIRTYAPLLPRPARKHSSVETSPQQSRNLNNSAMSDASKSQLQGAKTRRALLVRGLVVWLAFSVFAWVFTTDFMGIPELIRSVDSSAAWALLMHTTGFSMFLLLLTRQVRWLVLNIVLALGVLWLFSHTLPANWMLFNINSFGYLLLLMVLLIVLGVAGGLVYVWTNVVDFLKSLCLRYPQVHDDLRANKLLEQVLIRHLSELPRPALLQPYEDLNATAVEDQMVLQTSLGGQGAAATVAASGNGKVVGAPGGYGEGDAAAGENRTQAITHQPGFKESCPGLLPTTTKGQELCSVLHSRAGNGKCIFCLNTKVAYLLPVCNQWQPEKKEPDNTDGNGSGRMKMCTYFASLLQERDFLKKELVDLTDRNISLQADYKAFSSVIKKQEEELMRLKADGYKAVEAVLATEREKQDLISKELMAKVNGMARQIKQSYRQMRKTEEENAVMKKQVLNLQYQVQFQLEHSQTISHSSVTKEKCKSISSTLKESKKVKGFKKVTT
mmetsp:Transcript_38049/g.48522  ORF Transcript_38049/g.48522 Transcript_38049/m.48522 type:complete len:735 (+) Transcript_38049:198-2402(+)